MFNKKYVMSLIMLLGVSAFAQKKSVLNVFYYPNSGEIGVNINEQNGQTSFLRSNKIVVISKDISGCSSGCKAVLKSVDHGTFSININDQIIKKIKVTDVDCLMNSEDFFIETGFWKSRLVFKLDQFNIRENQMKAGRCSGLF